jgi:hypothetical protein
MDGILLKLFLCKHEEEIASPYTICIVYSNSNRLIYTSEQCHTWDNAFHMLGMKEYDSLLLNIRRWSLISLYIFLTGPP